MKSNTDTKYYPTHRDEVACFSLLLICTFSSVVSGEGAAESHPAEGDPQSAGVQTEVSQPPCQLCV